jgi:hypothetical protein
LLQDVDFVYHCKKHILDIIGIEGRSLIILHLVLLKDLL